MISHLASVIQEIELQRNVLDIHRNTLISIHKNWNPDVDIRIRVINQLWNTLTSYNLSICFVHDNYTNPSALIKTLQLQNDLDAIKIIQNLQSFYKKGYIDSLCSIDLLQ